MELKNKILPNIQVLKEIVISLVEKIPGIDKEEIHVEINQQKNVFNIYLKPIEYLLNLNNLAADVQNIIHNYLIKQFDIYMKSIKVNVVILSPKEKYKNENN